MRRGRRLLPGTGLLCQARLLQALPPAVPEVLLCLGLLRGLWADLPGEMPQAVSPAGAGVAREAVWPALPMQDDLWL